MENKAPLTSPPPQKPTITTNLPIPIPQIITTPPSPSPPTSLARSSSSSSSTLAPQPQPRSRIPPPRYYATRLTRADKACLARGEKNHNLSSWDIRDVLIREALREALVPKLALADLLVGKQREVERKTGKEMITFDDFLVPHGSGKGETHRDWVGKGHEEESVVVEKKKEKEKKEKKGGLVVPCLTLQLNAD